MSRPRHQRGWITEDGNTVYGNYRRYVVDPATGKQKKRQVRRIPQENRNYGITSAEHLAFVYTGHHGGGRFGNLNGDGQFCGGFSDVEYTVE